MATTTTTARRLVRLVAVLAIVAGLGMTSIGTGLAQTEDQGAVHVVAIDGEIDLGIAPFLDRALTEADDAGAAAVLLEIDTPGGRLDAVLQMRDALLASPVRTIAHVDPTAFSAGALIALAAQEIYFAPAGVMGAATPVVGGAGETADPKVVSAVASTFRATAEQRDRDPLVAEAMVDPAVEIDGLIAAGSLLTLTAEDAEAVGYREGVAPDRAALLEEVGLGDRDVVEISASLAERAVRFLTNPALASVFVAVGVLLIIGDLLAGGFGLGALAGAGLLGTFFWGHLLAGLAGWEDVVLVGIGVVLILVEIFVVPGFGVPGVLGLAAVLGGTYLAMVGRDLDFVSSAQLWATAGTVGLAFIGVAVGLIVLLTLLSRRRSDRDRAERRGRDGAMMHATTLDGDRMNEIDTTGDRNGPDRPRPEQTGTGQTDAGQTRGGRRRRLAMPRSVAGDARDRRGWLRWFGDGDVLEREGDPSGREAGAPQPPPVSASAARAAREGAIGIALTDLRPSGVADFEGHRIDVITEGDYLTAGEPVQVLHAERYRRVVRRAPDGDPVPS
jgi:membrane-bound serine protease (ClpP class)